MSGQWDRRERLMDKEDWIVHRIERRRFSDTQLFWFWFAIGALCGSLVFAVLFLLRVIQ